MKTKHIAIYLLAVYTTVLLTSCGEKAHSWEVASPSSYEEEYAYIETLIGAYDSLSQSMTKYPKEMEQADEILNLIDEQNQLFIAAKLELERFAGSSSEEISTSCRSILMAIENLLGSNKELVLISESAKSSFAIESNARKRAGAWKAIYQSTFYLVKVIANVRQNSLDTDLIDHKLLTDERAALRLKISNIFGPSLVDYRVKKKDGKQSNSTWLIQSVDMLDGLLALKTYADVKKL